MFEKKQRKNTNEIKYLSLLEDKNRQNEKMIDLQDKVIRLQGELRKRDIALLDYKEKEIEKYKKEKEKKQCQQKKKKQVQKI